jgi:Putative peptidoglycan binding domain
MPSLGFSLWRGSWLIAQIASHHERLMLNQRHSKNLHRAARAILALALGCLCFLPANAVAQSVASIESTSKPATIPKAAVAKTQPRSGSNTPGASSPKATANSRAASRRQSSVRSKSAAAKPAHKNSNSAHAQQTARSGRKSGKRKAVARGQQKIDHERAQEIQEALVREHYMTGEATGTWDDASEAAMRRYQADHGWQSKTVPDARALISLGLGPSRDHLLNPESAMTTGPEIPRAASLTPVSHSAEPATTLHGDPASTAGPAPVSKAGPTPANPPDTAPTSTSGQSAATPQ